MRLRSVGETEEVVEVKPEGEIEEKVDSRRLAFYNL
jgi:hypothetical protein